MLLLTARGWRKRHVRARHPKIPLHSIGQLVTLSNVVLGRCRCKNDRTIGLVGGAATTHRAVAHV